MSEICSYFKSNTCRSCQHMAQGHGASLALKSSQVAQLFAPHQVEAIISNQTPYGHRTKAKLVVFGSLEDPRLGMRKENQEAVELMECPLHHPKLNDILPMLKNFITRAKLVPYQLDTRQGELKFIILTYSTQTKDLLIRFVLRSKEALDRVRNELAWLKDQLQIPIVVTANIQAKHAAILEGQLELPITEQPAIEIVVNQLNLQLSARSFFQTNEAIAVRLYETAKLWLDQLPVVEVLDLFCGVGAFSFGTYTKARHYTGVEISAEAILSAQATQAKHQLPEMHFYAQDAYDFLAQNKKHFDVVIVNPPRRGLGDKLCAELLKLKPQYILYSSCNPESQAADIKILIGYAIRKIQPFDMFHLSSHVENLILLARD